MSGTNGTEKPQGMLAYRAPSLSQPHRARDAIKDAHDGKIAPLLGFFCGLACPPIAKMAAQMGFDFIWIDWEHAAMNLETMTQMVHDVQYMSEGRSMALVRVPGHDHANIGYALDAGASIMVPQVDTVEQAKHVTSAAKYGAVRNGTRSGPPCRLIPGVGDVCIDPSLTIYENVNNQAAVIIQIESELGIRNLDAILTECGKQIDSVWLGSFDCRVSMGLAGFWGDEPEWQDLMKIYEAALSKHNMPACGLSMGTPEVKKQMARGRSFVVMHSDYYAICGQGWELPGARAQFTARDHSGDYK